LVLPKNSPEAKRLCLEERGLYQWHRSGTGFIAPG